MDRHPDVVLIDTNAIIEAHRIGSWAALAGGYRIETVEECVTETQTGFHQRHSNQQIDPQALRRSMNAVHAVDIQARAGLAIRIQGIALDRGEASLWAHALRRVDDWLLCGPDKASLRCGVRLGLGERLVTLERLFDGIAYRSRIPLRQAYKRRWHQRVMVELALAEDLVR